jgi:hypothetical protein
MAGVLEEIIGLEQRRAHGEYALDGGAAPDTVAELEEAMTKAERADMLTEVMIIRKDDEKVISAFLNKKSSKSNYLKSTGKVLHGLWTGGKGIARWSGSKIVFSDKGDESFDIVQKAIKKAAPSKVSEGVEDDASKVEMATAYVLVDQLTEAYIGTVYKDGKDMYVDTAFLNNVSGGAPDFHIRHLGFGEFTIEGPGGIEIEVDRMRGKDFPGQSGRSHKLYPGKGADKKIVSKLVQQMIKKGKAKLQKKLKVPSPKTMAKKTGMKVRAKPRGEWQKEMYEYFMELYSDTKQRPWISVDELAGKGKHKERPKQIKALDAMVKSGLLDKQGDQYRLAENRATEAEDVTALTEALEADVDAEGLRKQRYHEPDSAQEETFDGDIDENTESILTAIAEADGATLSAPAIAEVTGIDKAAVRKALAEMGQAKLVARTNPAGDVWRLTHFGEACAKGKTKELLTRKEMKKAGKARAKGKTKKFLTRKEMEKFGKAPPKPKHGKWKPKKKLGEEWTPIEKSGGGRVPVGDYKVKVVASPGDMAMVKAEAKTQRLSVESARKGEVVVSGPAPKINAFVRNLKSTEALPGPLQSGPFKIYIGEDLDGADISERSMPLEIPYAKYRERHRKADDDQGFTGEEERKLRLMGVKDLVNMEKRLLKAYNKDRSKGNKLRLLSVQNLLARMNTQGQGRTGGGHRGHYSMFEGIEEAEEKGSYKAQGPLEKMIGEMVRGQSGKWLSKDQMKAIVRVLNKKGIKEPSKDSYDDIARIVGKTLSAMMKDENAERPFGLDLTERSGRHSSGRLKRAILAYMNKEDERLGHGEQLWHRVPLYSKKIAGANVPEKVMVQTLRAMEKDYLVVRSEDERSWMLTPRGKQAGKAAPVAHRRIHRSVGGKMRWGWVKDAPYLGDPHTEDSHFEGLSLEEEQGWWRAQFGFGNIYFQAGSQPHADSIARKWGKKSKMGSPDKLLKSKKPSGIDNKDSFKKDGGVYVEQ